MRMLSTASRMALRKMNYDLYVNRKLEAEKAYERLVKRENLDEIDNLFSIVDSALVDCGLADKPDHWIFIKRYK